MPQAKQFIVKCKCTYGKKGDIVELPFDKLSVRQSVMLSPYKAPEVKKATEQKKPEAKK